MIKNNQFYIENLQSVVFLGCSKVLGKLVDVNTKVGIKSLIITSSDQAKNIDNGLKFKIFNKIDINFKKYIKKNTITSKTLFVSLGARYIFKEKDIDNFFLNNLVNFHSTRLPLDGGSALYSWKIMREDRIDNQLVHLIDKTIDNGPIIDNYMSIYPRECKIPLDFQNYKFNSLINFYKIFIKKIYLKNKISIKPQQTYLGRYNPRINTETDGLIDWSMNSYDLYNFINAFDEPYKGASTYLNNGNYGKLYLKSVHLHGGDSSNHPYMSGIVSRHDKKWIVVSTKSKHMLLIEKIINKKGENIINKIKRGDRFFSPINEINNSKSKRVIFNSSGLKNNY